MREHFFGVSLIGTHFFIILEVYLMKRIISLFLLSVTLFLMLSSCQPKCKHSFLDATCDTPSTCQKCGETRGEALGHIYEDATCAKAATCVTCGNTTGKELGHIGGEATCFSQAICSICMLPYGELEEHDFTKQIVSDKYLCSQANESNPAKYYYACTDCEHISSITYEYGLPEIWSWYYYVDNKFQEPPDQWFIAPKSNFLGTFSNSATSNSKLEAVIIYDCYDTLTIFLYEYAREDDLVKNNSSKYKDYYEITMKNEEGKIVEMRGQMHPGGDRIFIIDTYHGAALNFIKTSKSIKVFILNEETPTTQYLFEFNVANFCEVLKSVR